MPFNREEAHLLLNRKDGTRDRSCRKFRWHSEFFVKILFSVIYREIKKQIGDCRFYAGTMYRNSVQRSSLLICSRSLNPS